VWIVLRFGVITTLAMHGPVLPLVLSVAPFASAIFMPGRLLVGPVPLWQIGLSLGLEVAAIGFCLWLAVRLLRSKL
jgi:ABC-type Na+ efflux pump permease subunit